MPQPSAKKNESQQRSKAAPASASQGKRSPKGSPASDELYGVVSVLYHALQGTETYEKYVADAEGAGDADLVAFFEQCRDQDAERAAQAKALLASRLEVEDEDDDDEDDDSEDEDEDDDET